MARTEFGASGKDSCCAPHPPSTPLAGVRRQRPVQLARILVVPKPGVADQLAVFIDENSLREIFAWRHRAHFVRQDALPTNRRDRGFFKDIPASRECRGRRSRNCARANFQLIPSMDAPPTSKPPAATSAGSNFASTKMSPAAGPVALDAAESHSGTVRRATLDRRSGNDFHSYVLVGVAG